MAMKVLPCNCENEYQDRKYGKYMRLHNSKLKEGWRCTNCGKDK
jgi:hypothetical protein